MSVRSGAPVCLAILISACAVDTSKDAPAPATEQRGVVRGEGIREENPGDRVLFAYDSAIIPQEYQLVIRRAAAWMTKYSTATITIEGHADERGTREYNLALGERRAMAVRRALIALGVSADRLSTVSYGKERPAVVGSNETAWVHNRRAVMVLN